MAKPYCPKSWQAFTCWLGCFSLMFNSWGLIIGYGTFASYYPGYPLKGKDQLQPNLIGSTQSGYWTRDGFFFCYQLSR